MSDTDYLNGIRVVKGGNDVRIILTPNQSVIGVVGTAPKADEKLLPTETPVVFFKVKEAMSAILPDPKTAPKVEDRGTLYLSVEAIFNQRSRTVVIVRAKSADTNDITNAIDKLLEAEALTNYKPKILCAPGHTANIPKDPPPVNPTPAPVNPTPAPVNPTPAPDPTPVPESDPAPTPLRTPRISHSQTTTKVEQIA